MAGSRALDREGRLGFGLYLVSTWRKLAGFVMVLAGALPPPSSVVG